MTKVIKENDDYLIFTTFTRDLDILVQTEPTPYIKIATEFKDEKDAEFYINLASQSGYDTSSYTIVDKEDTIKAKEESEKKAANDKAKKFWENLTTEAKRLFLYNMKPEDVAEYLSNVEDTSGITPFTEDEYKDHRIHQLEEKLGIEFTAEQKETIKYKEI